MLIDPDTNKIRLTRAELNRVRRANARQGNAINAGDVASVDAYHEALYMGLSDELAADMLEYLETGSSPGHRVRVARRLAREQRERRPSAVETAPAVPDELAAARRKRSGEGVS